MIFAIIIYTIANDLSGNAFISFPNDRWDYLRTMPPEAERRLVADYLILMRNELKYS